MAAESAQLTEPVTRTLTGLPAVDRIAQRKGDPSWGIYQLGRSGYSDGLGRLLRFKPKVDLEDLWKAYLSDGYIQRTVDTIVGLMIGNGIRWQTSPSASNYLRLRFEVAHQITGYGWDRLIRDLAFDFVLYGNAFLVKLWTRKLRTLGGRSLRPPCVAGWYLVPARCMVPAVDRDQNLTGWILRGQGGRQDRYFPLEDVVHLTYRRPLDSPFGVPFLLGVIEDVRSLRQMEEDVLRMVHRFVNPKFHISMPETPGLLSGIRPDMQQIVEAINSMSSDAVLVTLPGQKVQVIGAESFALRAEPYLSYFTQRVIGGLGMNDVMMGLKPSDPEMDTVDLSLRVTLRQMQRAFLDGLLDQIILPLMQEANWKQVQVSLESPDVDMRHTLRLFTIISNLYSQNVVTLSEARAMMGLDSPFDEQDSYTWRVRIPQVLEPLKFQVQYGLRGTGVRVDAGKGEPRARGRPPGDT